MATLTKEIKDLIETSRIAYGNRDQNNAECI
jgi:hypothetical protein